MSEGRKESKMIKFKQEFDIVIFGTILDRASMRKRMVVLVSLYTNKLLGVVLMGSVHEKRSCSYTKIRIQIF